MMQLDSLMKNEGMDVNSDLESAIRTAIGSLTDNSDLNRAEIYDYARAEIRKYYGSSGMRDSLEQGRIVEDLDRIISRVERDYTFATSGMFVPHNSSSSANKTANNDIYAHIKGIEIPEDKLPHERTALLLRNIGTGGSVSVIKILIQLALLPTMAHLLGPKEFGVYALAVPVVAFLAVIADGGVGLTLARDRTNSSEIWSTAFWILIISGFFLSVIVVIFGYFISLASSEPQLITVMLILAMSFPFLSITVLPIARLTRRGNLVVCAMADFVATVAGAICAVSLGFMGFGAKSLAFQYLTSYVIRAFIINLYAYERPTTVFRPSALLSHMSSGGILVGGRIADLACRSGESLLFGNAFGAATLGAYNFANQVPRFLFESFSNPTWSALYAQSLNEQHERLIQIYYKVCRLMAFVTFPTAAVLTAAGPEILGHILGPKWEQAGIFLRILAPGYALSITASMGTALLLASNANFAFFITTIVLGLGRVTSVAAGYYLMASSSVALVTLSNIVYAAAVCGFASRIASIRIISLLRELAGSLVASIISGIICCAILEFGGRSLIMLVAAIFTAALCYISVMFMIDGDKIKNELLYLKAVAASRV